MKNQGSVFLIFCLSLTVGLLGVFAMFMGHFNGHEQYEMRISSLKTEIEKERFEKTLLTYQIKDFQQSVAQVLPANDKLVAKYEEKNLASVVRQPASVPALDLSGALFARGKKSFADQNYDKAIKEFGRLVEAFPLSQYNVESRFFIAESYFLKKDFKSSLAQIDDMVSLYPDNDLTGFILLRMGQISEANNQIDEASEVYKAVIKNFKNEALRDQARKLAKGIEYK